MKYINRSNSKYNWIDKNELPFFLSFLNDNIKIILLSFLNHNITIILLISFLVFQLPLGITLIEVEPTEDIRVEETTDRDNINQAMKEHDTDTVFRLSEVELTNSQREQFVDGYPVSVPVSTELATDKALILDDSKLYVTNDSISSLERMSNKYDIAGSILSVLLMISIAIGDLLWVLLFSCSCLVTVQCVFVFMRNP